MFGMRLRERGFVSNKIKRGPHKDRKGWFGIGLRAAHPDPEDPEGSSDEPSDGAGTGADSPLGESRSSKPDSSGGGASSGQSGPKIQNPPCQSPRVEEDSEKRSASSASSAHTDWSADPMRFYRSGGNGQGVPE